MSPRTPTAAGQRRALAQAATVVVAMVLLMSCGVPEGGSAESIDDASVPYRLLDPGTSAPASSYDAHPPDSVPLLFWLDDADLLTPVAARASCAEPPAAQVEQLLAELSVGPTEEVRAGGNGTAIAPQSGLGLVRIDDGTAVVEVDPGSSTSADRLPLAMGQVALTVTSARGVKAVSLVSDGDPMQVPLPGGALTSSPVTSADYASLLGEDRGGSSSQPGPTRWLGCPTS